MLKHLPFLGVILFVLVFIAGCTQTAPIQSNTKAIPTTITPSSLNTGTLNAWMPKSQSYKGETLYIEGIAKGRNFVYAKYYGECPLRIYKCGESTIIEKIQVNDDGTFKYKVRTDFPSGAIYYVTIDLTSEKRKFDECGNCPSFEYLIMISHND